MTSDRAPLSKDERAGLVAEIAEVEAEIKRLQGIADQARQKTFVSDYTEETERLEDWVRELHGKIKALRARLPDLKRREASDER